MTKRITIYTKSTGRVLAEISSEKNPKTARAIYEALPIRATVNRWGDEIYFTIPVKMNKENSQQEVDVGDLGYWPQGNGFCIFFGRTPASIGAKPRAASPVNIFGRVIGDPEAFRKVRSGEEILIESA
jgi:hypothetical protein